MPIKPRIQFVARIDTSPFIMRAIRRVNPLCSKCGRHYRWHWFTLHDFAVTEGEPGFDEIVSEIRSAG